jgi:biotin-dependent carboxylase-like uncharacterized protein
LTLVQDLGRPGWAHLGVTRSGAADRGAFALANRLVANVEHAPGLEVTLGGLALQAQEGTVQFAVTGASCPITVAGRPSPARALLTLAPGEVLELGPARHGLRCYLAVRGGLDVVPQLGSCATDVLSGLGPAPLADGDTLVVCSAERSWASGWPVTDLAPGPGVYAAGVRAPGIRAAGVRVPGLRADDVVQLLAVPGPRDDLLAGAGLAELTRRDWQAGQDSDRVGVRLRGEPLPMTAGSGHLRSEPVVRGAVQVPPSGQPVLFLADHPVTGGYPVIAVLTERSADAAAQLRPGDQVRIAVTARPAWGSDRTPARS